MTFKEITACVAVVAGFIGLAVWQGFAKLHF
ncbi:hypothetical protein PSSA1_v1c3010 [Candidatus Phytoplasma solani]|uniref:Uncharacterized protein n=1 Tax=Candidatus Phytoplasma solani TaxID=69896 RepID=A0A421NUU4_9MOLU|nr:hypothetical protein PSSA1_v1c6340 [Candidatus Phytoplasma solani]RMI87761.1 hypothetical protein PSSA1_v1c5960 [Candidatus Phytoplasma solani]RMI88874.1 hypothetical protein PSSA1_v1c3010 [Candidatus Phytoplasma solani]